MLVQQESLPLSACSDFYDFIVPKDNLIRKINELISCSVSKVGNQYESLFLRISLFIIPKFPEFINSK
ncbi:MAG: hypothetical protein WA839_09855, partial [Flavobacteriaceae bacterium]